MSEKHQPESIEASGLPESIEKAITAHDYKPAADLGVTSLVGPPRIRVLKGKHGERRSEDPMDNFFRWYGQMGHAVAEEHGKQIPGALVETPLWIRWPFDAPYPTVGGRPDLLDVRRGTLWDYKIGSYKRYKGGCPVEYVRQLQCYAAIARLRGIEISTAYIFAVYRDWSQKDAQYRRNECPPRPWRVFQVRPDLLEQEECMAYLAGRVRVHLAAEKELPECTDEERWARGAAYALYDLRDTKPGEQKPRKARRVLESEEKINAFASTTDIPEEHRLVEYRPAESARCEGGFCPVSDHCDQFKRLKGGSK